MIHWQNIPPSLKVEAWKQLRRSLTSDNYITETVDFFKTLPVSSRTMDYYDSSTWLTPWELMYTGLFCESSRALMIFYTLIFFDRSVRMHLIDDSGEIYLVVEASNLILNYRNTIVKRSDVSLAIKQTYDINSIKQIF